MSAAKIHVMAHVRMTDRRHGPAILTNQHVISATSYQNSMNWSGEALTTNASSFGSNSFAEVAGQWILSAEQQAVGTCSGTDEAATWVGIDGNGSTDVLQAGTEGDVACSNGVTTQNYYPWFEWYPSYAYEITNFIEFRGATVFVVVHATSATSGTAMFVNLQTNAYTNVNISAPSGTSLKGNCAEWIVERPSIGDPGVIGTLADFGLYGINAEVAYTQSGLQNNNANFAGSPDANQTSVLLTMVNANNTILASPSPAGSAAQFVYPEGPTL